MDAKTAALTIGISRALLRRHALDYEKVFQAMPRNANNNARFYEEGFCETVIEARELRRQGLCTSILHAFECIRDDNVPVIEKPRVLVPKDNDEFVDLIARIDKLQEHIERLERIQTPQLLAPSGEWGWWNKLVPFLIAVLAVVGFGAIAVIFVWASELNLF